jgi:hypothetical protein|tara:strand:- start:93 stop:449 length:357 start_codon:yes stop_codon:yes gene_type:complete
MANAKLGGGAIFRNQRKVEKLTLAAEYTPDGHPRAPELSGDVGFTKEAVKMLVAQFKNGKTEVSQVTNQHEAKLEIAASIKLQRDGVTPYLSVWFSEPYEKPAQAAPADDGLDDDIPF